MFPLDSAIPSSERVRDEDMVIDVIQPESSSDLRVSDSSVMAE
jgi:hypothetical protein